MKLIEMRKRTVCELVFATPQGKQVTVELDQDAYDQFIREVSDDQKGFDTTRSTGDAELEYEDDDEDDEQDAVVEDMNERLTALGLPLMGEEEADGVDQL